MAQNNWQSKIVRTVNCLKPIDTARSGNCSQCGKCCRMPNKCVFLNKENKCSVYGMRPLNCRKYPRCSKEQVDNQGCTYSFRI